MSTTERDMLMAVLANMKFENDIPSREELMEKALVLGPVMGVREIEDIERAVRDAECQRKVTIRPGIILRSKKPHNDSWVERLESKDWQYWNSYELLMKQQGRAGTVIAETAKSTLQTLSWLTDPKTPGSWSRKGLVIGHVQSGKTANFVGLISRSADAGYRFIVVLGGTLNSLRQQTQQRLDTDFIGHVMRDGRSEAAGVGKLRDPKVSPPASLTSETHDFNRMIPNQIKTNIESFGTLVVVIKKNVTTLRNLKNWLQLYSQKNGSIQMPLLVIDDEADYASVNTNDPSKNPTSINGVIREILGMFDRNAYIGYTATPFANVFINPESDSLMQEDSLFPEHFIQVLEPPSDYFGPQLVFPVDDGDPDEVYEATKWVKTIADAEDVLPLKQGKTTNLSSLPPSLCEAFKIFVLTRAIRRTRGDGNRHCSMLINLSHLTRIHQQTAELMEQELSKIRLTVTYCHNAPAAVSGVNEEWQNLKTLFAKEFSDIPETWENILPHLRTAVDEVVIRSLHKDSTDKLDYAERTHKGEPLVVVAIGGNTLSRGLTLEDLTVSYLRRSTSYADSLLQMGRWFGYRPNYEDLCRIWLTPELLAWYHFITGIDQDLRRQVKAMIRDKREPKDFALRVRNHPDTLLLTAQNKMRNTSVIKTRLSLAGRLKEMSILSNSADINAHNRAELQKFQVKLEALITARDLKGTISYQNIPRSLISEFTSNFRFHTDWQDTADLVEGYITETSEDHPLWDVMFYSGQGANSALSLNGYKMKQRKRRVQFNKISEKVDIPSSGNGYYINKQRLGGKGDEAADFNEEQQRDAINRANTDERKVVSEDYLVVRKKPLLMVHLIELYEQAPNSEESEFRGDQLGIPALGFGFPFPADGKEHRTTEVRVNQAIYERLLGALKTDPDGEPDADDDDEV